jgi:hypothetical protein
LRPLLPFNSNSPFNGIFTLLYFHSTNPFSEVVSATGSQFSGSWGNASVIIDPTLNDNTKAHNWVNPGTEATAFFEIHFHAHAVRVRSYSIQTRTEGGIENFPVSWRLDGLQTATGAFALHNISNTTDLQEAAASKTYPCADNGFFSQFRLTMTAAQDGTTPYVFHISQVEFFGEFYPLFDPKESCQSYRSPLFFFCLVLLFLVNPGRLGRLSIHASLFSSD